MTATTSLYPPESHALRDLPFEMGAISEDRSRAWVDLDRGLAPDGVVSVGALATVADVLAGSLCARAVAPDWMATSALSLHLGDLPTSGCLVVDAQIARLGRTTLVIQISFAPGDATGATDAAPGPAVGDGVASFSRLPRRDTNLDITDHQRAPEQRVSMSLPGSGLNQPFEDAIGGVVVDAAAGVTLTPVVPYVQNSFGAVNGGIAVALAYVSARATVDARCERTSRTVALSVQYLRQMRAGQVRTDSQIIRSAGCGATVRVELRDAAVEGADGSINGADPRSWSDLMAVAHVTLELGANR